MSQLAALLFLLCAALPAAAGIIPERVETALKARIATGELSSAVVAMVSDGQTQVEGFGALPDGKVPDGDTIFEIGSVTKTFTATLLADAALRGEVTLDEPIRLLLPGYSIPKRGDREITLLDIAEHRSGLPRIPGDLHAKDAGDPYAGFGPAELKEFLASYQLPRDPGSLYEYSNLAVGMLGYALAQSRHTDYAGLVAERILRPLGMGSTGVALSSPRLAPGFGEDGNPARPWDLNVLAGAGGIRSSASDMLRYVEAYMGRRPTPLRAAMDLAELPREAVGRQRIGLIWMTHPLEDGRALVWHNGLTGGYASFVGFTADGRSGIVILTNRAHPIDDLGFAAIDPRAPLAPARKEVPQTEAQLAAYQGTYKLGDKFFLSVTAGRKELITRATGQSQLALFASAENEFFAKIANISVSFTRDGAGAVTGLVLHQNGDHPAPRVAERDAAAELGAIDLPADTLAAYAGRYELRPGIVLEFGTGKDQLQAQIPGQPSFPLFARAADHFFYLAVDAQVTFERDPAGAVTGLILHQGGRDLPARRL